MKYIEEKIESTVKGQQLFVRVFKPEGEMKAVLQVVHGMAEHSANYNDFAAYLAERGYLVLVPDHLGHGRSVSSGDDYGYFFEGGIDNIIRDVKKLRDQAAEQTPGLPYFIMGHSMGSFIVREYIARYENDLTGAIIMGTSAGVSVPMWLAEKNLLKSMIVRLGEKGRSKKIDAMATGGYNKKIAGAEVPNSWVSSDEAEVEKYNKDPMCGFGLTLSAYESMGELLQNINKKSWYKRVPRDLPILIVSGREDPVGDMGTGVRKVASSLVKSEHQVETILYPGKRHALVNEKGREEVFEDIKSFMDYKILRAKKKA